MKWVTRERPKTDRIACPWLILRFIDAEAESLYVPTSDVLDVAERENALSFDARERGSTIATGSARSRSCSRSTPSTSLLSGSWGESCTVPTSRTTVTRLHSRVACLPSPRASTCSSSTTTDSST